MLCIFERKRSFEPRSAASRSQMDKEIDSPQELPEGIGPASTSILAQRHPFLISDLQNYTIINLCCFKALSL